ncbi:hypothetical protein SKAU_G00314180 [Synaphobranchus kaupii]|uniref:Uncharacterized protein n=1 Tax=Synaphobranchus kaupii TaxID=118154 RepID=A0A9Q1ESC4_SYNKA|nr:hypothetical protein SKAU_G00314180 [Synaphobranchus kaupii]
MDCTGPTEPVSYRQNLASGAIAMKLDGDYFTRGQNLPICLCSQGISEVMFQHIPCAPLEPFVNAAYCGYGLLCAF